MTLLKNKLALQALYGGKAGAKATPFTYLLALWTQVKTQRKASRLAQCQPKPVGLHRIFPRNQMLAAGITGLSKAASLSSSSGPS